ncbi:MAG: NAD(P)/FAD-dependent oxidoreductase, partial [Gammaproteobacteria bacterium]
NAAADLLGLPLHPYSQPKYVTCLDLGPWGAVYTEGWERAVVMSGAEAKALKRSINTEWIYPPADRATAFALAAPDHVIVP